MIRIDEDKLRKSYDSRKTREAYLLDRGAEKAAAFQQGYAAAMRDVIDGHYAFDIPEISFGGSQ